MRQGPDLGHAVPDRNDLRSDLLFLLLIPVMGASAVVPAPGSGKAEASVMVIQSAGPSARSFRPGKRLPDGKTIVLKPLDRIVILDDYGTRLFQGPGSFRTAATKRPIEYAKGLGSVVQDPQQTTRRARASGVRGDYEGNPDRPAFVISEPHYWDVDTARSGNHCYFPPFERPLHLFQPVESKTRSVRIRLAGGKERAIAIDPGANAANWPEDLVPPANSIVVIKRPGARPVKIRFVSIADRVPDRPGRSGELAAALLKERCYSQLTTFVRQEAAEKVFGPEEMDQSFVRE